jgi:hypothetical protein
VLTYTEGATTVHYTVFVKIVQWFYMLFYASD